MGQAALKSVDEKSTLDVSSALDTVTECAADGRAIRQIPDKAIEAIKKTGYFKAFLPKQYGGLESTPQEFFKAAVDIAERDMGTAWASGIIAVHAYQLSLMDPKAAEDVYATGPDTFICSSYNPAGAKVETVDGGFKLSGQWGWSSGSGHCSWVLLGGLIFDQGQENIHYRTFLVPKSDYEIVDTWNVMGLQSTGSNDVVIKDSVFVPEYRTHHQMDGFNCKHYQDNPMYSIPWAQMFVRVVCTPAIGAAKHALQLFIDNATGSSTDPTRLAGDPDVTRRIAEASNLIDETEAIMYRNFDRLMGHVMAGEEIPMIDRIKFRYQASLVIERMMEAVDLLFDVAGGRSVFNDSPIQQIWHDIHIARAHVANSPVGFARNLGAVQLGADSTDVFV
ncbi:MAG: flavin-dependent monooxygenase [Acidimicrobiales bacterium]|nr:MAG: flavin-dependent monooxygenase [Acidimicrobiales bacterium]